MKYWLALGLANGYNINDKDVVRLRDKLGFAEFSAEIPIVLVIASVFSDFWSIS